MNDRECIATDNEPVIPGLIFTERGVREIWPKEYDFWMRHVLPFGWSIVVAPSSRRSILR
jgi:hypothetical protein